MAKMTAEERKQIYNYCMRNMVLVYSDGGNWDIFMDDRQWCFSIAKPSTGCGNSCFGSLDYVKNLIKENHFKREFLKV